MEEGKSTQGDSDGRDADVVGMRDEQNQIIFRLTYSYIGMYYLSMARAATTSDAFNAVAEPRRREILDYLATQERPVGDIVAQLGLEQPSVSKHLRVLKDVGLVRVRREGRQMVYSLEADEIRPLYEWTRTFERFWRGQLQRVKERAEKRAGQEGSGNEG